MVITGSLVNDKITIYDDSAIKRGDFMSEIDWNKRAKNLLRAEMTRKDVTVRDLAEKLGEDERNLANKISRGTFTAAFMLQCLESIGSRDLRLD